ncbi:shikimate dehydrogenase family protein [Parapedobacter lycopersici]|uniref:shikimate dehydrogenase family protein n=1 Tax=Parapedobacter lycopersici TaxID=1864939 RepID=UPI00214D8F22|nr:shikimate dehydrogenase [Parapedobacter lycopersici]
MKNFGLIGYPLTHSFSKRYYDAKFEREQIKEVDYQLYPIESISALPELISNDPQLAGINVTIPYKIAVMDYLHQLSPEAEAIAAVNCIRIDRQTGEPILTGYNTDVFGFMESLKPLLQPWHTSALVLGNGGAAKAVIYALTQLGIAPHLVSRRPEGGQYTYSQLSADVLSEHLLLVNTTPLGTYPDIDNCPDIPYEYLGEKHLLYDLVYNPAATAFLKRGARQGAAIKNGLEMLELQAERNWQLWNS